MLRATLVSLGLVTSAVLFSQISNADKGNTGIDHSAGVAAPVLLSPEDAFFAIPAPPCEDRIPLSPVLMYTSAGGTLLGLQFDQITVYSSGLVLLAGAESHSNTMSARMAQVSPFEVVELGRDLARLGAGAMCDQTYDVSDVPLKTISLASGMGTNVSLHSFSYWLPTDQHGMIESALEQWLLDNRLIGEVLE
jgi:hypothetical protein